MVRTVLLALLAALAAAPAAHAHAILERTTPERGASVAEPPRTVSFTFDERVEAAFGAVRVFDERGDRVDDGTLLRPGGAADVIATGLRADVPDGTYTATYRAVSADSHPVSGGFVFTVGEGGSIPAATVSELLADGAAGPVTTTAFGAVRAIGYAALAAAIGALAFLVLVWIPALAAVAGGARAWLRAGERFGDRLRAVVLAAAAAGVVTSGSSLVLQGAIAGGTTVWAALDPSVLGDVVATRFGEVTVLRLLAWVLGAGLVLWALRGPRGRVLQPASVGATGLAPSAPAGLAVLGLAAGSLGVVAVSFGLGGHAGATAPTWLMLPADAVHLVAMAVWIGGLVLLVTAVPVATRAVDPSERSRLLAAVLARFSPVATASVAALVLTGVAQSIVHLEAFADLVDTAFGRAILVKTALLGGLVGLGAYNQRRLMPRLRALAAGGRPPGGPGRLLRRSLRSELLLAMAVLGATAALVSSSPASAGGSLLSESLALGPVRMELTVEPLRAGSNEMHVYLLDARTGAQVDSFDELEVEVTLPEQRIGPLEVDLRKAGPGHFTTTVAPFAPAGAWELRAKLRLNRFDVHRAEVEVPIR